MTSPDNNIGNYRRIGEEGGTEALALVADLMEASARQREHIERGIIESLEASVGHWKGRAETAEAQLAAIERRVMSILFMPPNPTVFDA